MYMFVKLAISGQLF